MADRNQLTLVGRIGGVFKEGKTKNGEMYVYFPLELQARQTQNSTENNKDQLLHIMCFRRQVIEYLRKVGARPGNIVVVFGFVSSYQDTIGKQEMWLNAVNAHECFVVKTTA